MTKDVKKLKADAMGDLEQIKYQYPSLRGISPSLYRSERVDSLWQLTDKGFKPLAWTPNVRYLFYNPKKDLLVSDIEGDLRVWENPTKDIIEREVQQYPMMEVSLGEKYDRRFKRAKDKLDEVA